MNKKTKIQENKAITLIALVITIIVLIILAGVAINLAFGQNGLFTRAKTAREEYSTAEAKEKLEQEILNVQIQAVQEGKDFNLKYLKEKIDKTKYEITLDDDENPTIAVIKEIGSNYYLTVDSKLKVTKVEEQQPKPQYVKFSDLTWTSGKASIELSTKEAGTIEYKVGKDGIYQAGTTISNLSNGDIVYVRVNNNGTYTDEDILEIKDKIEPEEFTITASDITYEGVKLTGSTQDLQTGIRDYTYVAISGDTIVKEIKNQTVTEYTITELNEETEYVVYMLAYDNAGNVRKSNEVKVKTKGRPKITTFDFINNKNDFEDIEGKCIADENGLRADTYENTGDLWSYATTKIQKDIDWNSNFEIIANIIFENNNINSKMGGIEIQFYSGDKVQNTIRIVDWWIDYQLVQVDLRSKDSIYYDETAKVQASGEYKIIRKENKIKAMLNNKVLGETDYKELEKCDNIKIKFRKYQSNNTPTVSLKELIIKTQLQ